MAIYTYAGPKDRQNGVTELRVASGSIPVGHNGDLTVAEYNSLSPDHDLRAGAVTITQANNPAFKVPSLSKLAIYFKIF